MTKILFVSHTADIGGAELSMRDLLDGLNLSAEALLFENGPLRGMIEKLGVRVISRQAPKAVRLSAYQIGFMRRIIGQILALIFALKLQRLFRRYSIIYVNSHQSLFVCGVAAKLARRKLIWHQRIIVDQSRMGTLREKISNRFLVILGNHFAHRVICISDYAAKTFIRSGGNMRKVLRIYNGIHPDRLTGERDELVGDQTFHRVSDGIYKVGIFGRLQRWKGQDIAIRVIRRIRNGQLIIVGSAKFTDRVFEEELHELVDQISVKERVTFLGHCEDVSSVMSSVDVVLQTQREPEAFGRVTVEAMMLGKVVIAADFGGSSEIITDGIDGFLVEPENIAGFTDVLNTVIGCEETRNRIGLAARKTAYERFHISRCQKEVAEVIRELSQ